MKKGSGRLTMGGPRPMALPRRFLSIAILVMMLASLITALSSATAVACDLAINKTGPATGCEGDTITYTFTVTNTGTTSLNNVTVTDPLFGGGWSKLLGTMAAGASQTFTQDYTIPEGAPDPLPNTATAKGTILGGAELVAEASWQVDIVYPDIKIEKTGPATGCEGDTITYSFKVTNTGVTSLDNVTVTDPLFGSGWSEELGAMAPNAVKEFDKKYTIPKGAPDPLNNTATVTGQAPCGEVTSNSSWQVDIVYPDIKIEKTGPASARVGDTITYTFTVTNIGETSLDNVTVTDPLFGSGWSKELGTMAAGASQTFTQDYTIPEGAPDPLKNTATVTGQAPCGEVTSNSSWEVDILATPTVPRGSISITKTLNDSDGTVKVNEIFSYSIKVENTGKTFIPAKVQLKDIYDTAYQSYQFADPSSDNNVDDGEITWSDISGGEGLKPGESVVVTVYFSAKKAGASPQTDNTAKVSATDEHGTHLTDESTAEVTIVPLPPAPKTPAPAVQPPAQPTTPVVQPAVLPPAQPTTPVVQPAVLAPEEQAELPYTGDNLGIFLMLGWNLIQLGLVLMIAHAFLRRRYAAIRR